MLTKESQIKLKENRSRAEIKWILGHEHTLKSIEQDEWLKSNW